MSNAHLPSSTAQSYSLTSNGPSQSPDTKPKLSSFIDALTPPLHLSLDLFYTFTHPHALHWLMTARYSRMFIYHRAPQLYPQHWGPSAQACLFRLRCTVYPYPRTAQGTSPLLIFTTISSTTTCISHATPRASPSSNGLSSLSCVRSGIPSPPDNLLWSGRVIYSPTYTMVIAMRNFRAALFTLIVPLVVVRVGMVVGN